MDKSEVYGSWFNKGAGLELLPDVNNDIRKYTGENLTLFYSEYVSLCGMLGDISSSDQQICSRLLNDIEVSDRPGAYHRDLSSKENYDNDREVNPISKDNLLGIVLLMRNLKLEAQLAKMRSRFVKSFGTFNNTKQIRTPFNPGFYSPFGALLGGIIPNIIGLLCLPVFFVNFIITNSKKPEDTSSRLLYFFELYQLRKHLIFGPVFWIYKKLLKRTYKSENPLLEMCKIYYWQNENNPIRKLSEKAEGKY